MPRKPQLQEPVIVDRLWANRQHDAVYVTLSRYDLSVWDVPSQTWVRAPGTYSLSVGASSRDFRLKGTLLL